MKILGTYAHQSYAVLALCVGIIAGVIVGLVVRVEYFVSGWWVVLAVVLLVLAYFNPKVGFVGVALVAGVVLALVRVAGELGGQEYVRQFYGKEVIIHGMVEGDPNVDETEMKVKLGKLEFGEGRRAVDGSIYMTVRGGVEMRRADEVTVKGKLSEGFGTYVGYMYKPEVKAVRRPEPGDLVLVVRDWFAGRVREMIPEPEVALGLSYLLGMKTGLSEGLAENLRAVGLTHIVVASGAHLAILVGIARKIFGKLSRFMGLMLAILFTVFFMMVVGWTPSILRAGVMVILTLVAWFFGREFVPLRLILLVAAFTLMLEPMYVVDLGWLLSFASYAGITMLGPRLAKLFYGEKEPGFVASMILTTVAATVMTLPITLYYFGAVSLISVVANLLILPTLGVAMGLVFATGVVAGLPLVGTALAWVVKMMLDFHIGVVEFFGGMRQFVMEVEPEQFWVLGGYGPVLLFVIWSLIKRVWYNRKHE